ncbi:MAG: hypothetical protein J3Q66DRAFT_322685 [Benniella sp.]|nr:MAG: hypothetical protein J3Q66DRAFT_322685 [Benniella sp.]
MSLHGVITTLRTIILISCLIAIGLDIYFVKVYFDYKNVAFFWIWRFSGRAGLNLLWGVFFLISLITLVGQNRHRRYEPTSSPPAGGMTERLNCGQLTYSIVRTIVLFVMGGAMLYVTGNALVNENRTIFTLPNSRESPEYAALKLDFRRYDPKNLRHCPSYTNNLSLLCPLDNSVTSLLAIVAGLVLIEAPLSLMNNMRSTRATYSQHTDMEVLRS